MTNEAYPVPGQAERVDQTTRQIYEVIRTLGGSAVEGHHSPFTTEFPDPKVFRPGTYKNLMALGNRVDTVTRVVRGEDVGGRDIGDEIRDRVNVLTTAPDTPAMREAVEGGREYLYTTEPLDRFDLQSRGAALALASQNGVMRLDLIDLVLALRASMQVDTALLSHDDAARRARASERFPELERAYLTELVDALDLGQLFGEDLVSLSRLYAHVHGTDPQALGYSERNRIRFAQALIRERLTISDLVVEGGLWTDGERHGGSPYARPRSGGELARLNDHAADTIERLHLLTGYDMVPYEISAETLQLPWDVAVVPALEFGADGTPRYADGAVADFLFITPNRGQAERSALLADTDTRLRLRLHDNGQISHGFDAHNVPSNATERAFMQDMSAIAFQQIRGLLITLAFDAIAPNSVVQGRVGGSTATILGQGSGNMGDRLTGLLQQRSLALQQARVTESSPDPEGWEPPRQKVGGYKRRLPAGSRPRPTAEAEARAYYESIGEPFEGLPEGYTFVKPYTRRARKYRPASFRPTP